jgi:hypothetical protein
MTTYKITGYFRGTLYASYSRGLLQQALAELEAEQPVCEPPGGYKLPLKEFDLLHSEVLTATVLKPRTVAEKVALFCMHYKKHKSVAYRATREEKANMKLVTVNEQLLNTYFTHTAYPLTHTKSMADYVRHYNTVRDLAANGVPQKKTFPDHPDSDYEKTLSPEKLSAYRVHLRELGWRKVDGVYKKTETI